MKSFFVVLCIIATIWQKKGEKKPIAKKSCQNPFTALKYYITYRKTLLFYLLDFFLMFEIHHVSE